MPIGDFIPAPKPSTKKKGGTQRRRGEISATVDEELKARSHGVCELCGKTRATERAHLTGRPHIDHKTAVTDLAHVCKACHLWLDENVRGIQAKRLIARVINEALSHLKVGG